jgi:hypothetical protein
LLAKSRKPISAIIDGRFFTVLAFQSILGKNRIIRLGDFHYVKPTSKYDIFVSAARSTESGGDITAHVRKLIEENIGTRCDVGVEWNV